MSRIACLYSARPSAKRLLVAGLALALSLATAQMSYAAEALDEQMSSVYGVDKGYEGGGAELLREAFKTFLSGDRDKAFDQLKGAVGADQTLPPPRVLLARLFFAANRVDIARVELEQAAVEAPGSPEVYLLFGNLALAEGRLTDAALQYAKALDQAGASERRDAEEQKPLLRQLYAGQTTVAERRQDWKTCLIWAKQWDTIAGPAPADAAQAKMRIARATFFDGNAEAARAMLDQAMELDKTLDNPLVTMAGWSSQKGDTETAEKYMQEAVEKSPEDSRVQSAMSTLLLVLGHVEEAQKHAEKAVTLDPDSDALKRLKGVIAMHRKDWTQAETIFRELYMKSPSDRDAVNNLAISLAEMGGPDNLRRAQELAEVNARSYPNSSQELATLGWVYYRLGRTADAAELLRKAVSGGQASSDTAYFLAQVMAAQGKLEDAMKFLEAALNVKGTFVFRDAADRWLTSLRGSMPATDTTPAKSTTPPAKGK